MSDTAQDDGTQESVTPEPKTSLPRAGAAVERHTQSYQEPRQEPRVRLADDGDIPSDAKLLELTPQALSKRLERATKAELTRRFGTTDVDSIPARLERLAELEANEKEREMSELSAKERAEAEREEYRERAERAEVEARSARDQVVVQRVDTKVTNLVSKFVKDRAVPSTLLALKADINENWSEHEKNDMDAGMARAKEFFEDYVKEIPELGKNFQSNYRVEPLSTGPRRTNPGSQTDESGRSSTTGMGKKAVKDMNKAEWAAHKKSLGLS